jgi:hypothetical protein
MRARLVVRRKERSVSSTRFSLLTSRAMKYTYSPCVLAVRESAVRVGEKTSVNPQKCARRGNSIVTARTSGAAREAQRDAHV